MQMNDNGFKEALSTAKIPILVLDQKWHRLFALSGKPDDVKELEKKLNDLLARQGKLNQELKDYKKVKSSLMQNIVENMEGTETNQLNELISKKLEEDKRLIADVNEKIAADEDELLEIPKEMKAVNEELMMATMSVCYDLLRTNSSEVDEITAWIKKIRVELKKNIIRKQNREINNKEIYAYMHDIFGKDVINLFDVRYEDFDIGTKDDRPEAETENTSETSSE